MPKRSCLPCPRELVLLFCHSVVVNPPSSVYATGFLCVNDDSASRMLRLRKVLHSYVPKPFLTGEKLRITSFDGSKWGEIERNAFDRVSQCHIIKFIIYFFRKNYRLPMPELMTCLSKCLVLSFLRSGSCGRPLHHRQTFPHGGRQQYIQQGQDRWETKAAAATTGAAAVSFGENINIVWLLQFMWFCDINIQ